MRGFEFTAEIFVGISKLRNRLAHERSVKKPQNIFGKFLIYLLTKDKLCAIIIYCIIIALTMRSFMATPKSTHGYRLFLLKITGGQHHSIVP